VNNINKWPRWLHCNKSQIDTNYFQVIGVKSGFPLKCASKFAMTRSAMAMQVSTVSLPTWGVNTTFWSLSSSSCTSGSFRNTSRPAPPTLPSINADTSSGSSTCGPRPMLIKIPFGPNASITPRFTMWRVSGVRVQATTSTSDSAAKSRTLE